MESISVRGMFSYKYSARETADLAFVLSDNDLLIDNDLERKPFHAYFMPLTLTLLLPSLLHCYSSHSYIVIPLTLTLLFLSLLHCYFSHSYIVISLTLTLLFLSLLHCYYSHSYIVITLTLTLLFLSLLHCYYSHSYIVITLTLTLTVTWPEFQLRQPTVCVVKY